MATTNLALDGDRTTNWDTSTGANHYDQIYEGTGSPNDSAYIQTTTLNDTDQFTLGATPANTSSVTEVTVNVRGYLDDDSNGVRLAVSLWRDMTGTPTQVGTTQYITVGAGAGQFDAYGTTLSVAAVTFSGLSLTKAQADDLEVRIVFEAIP